MAVSFFKSHQFLTCSYNIFWLLLTCFCSSNALKFPERNMLSYSFVQGRNFLKSGNFLKNHISDRPVLQSAHPRAVALASYTVVDKIIKNTVGFTRKAIWNDYNWYYASDCLKVSSSVMNVNCYNIVYFSMKSFHPHFRSFETYRYSCIISYCAAFYLSTVSHGAVGILASPESIAGGAPNCKTGELWSVQYPRQDNLISNNLVAVD